MNRFSDTKKAGIAGIFANIFLLLIKGFIGFVTSSQAMIADAVNVILSGERAFDRAHIAKTITDKFSQDSIIDEFIHVYEEAVGESG